MGLKKFSIYFLLLLNVISDAYASSTETNYSDLNKANYFILVDQDSGEILLEKNSGIEIAPSSMTKLMTAYVVFNQLKEGKVSLYNQCFIGSDAWRKAGSKMFLNYGDVVTVDQLLTGLLAVSANDASIALAEIISGNIVNFVDLMNQTADEIGLKNSHFENPHGLNEKGHYMSVKDLAILAIRIRKNFPEYCHYFSIPKMTYGKITQLNRNPLLLSDYFGATGMKTGYTGDGGYGMVGSASRDGRNLIAVVNKTQNDKERKKIITELLDYGFNNYKKITIFDKKNTIAQIKTWLGNKENLNVVLDQDAIVVLQKDVPISDIKARLQYSEPIYAPIKKGQKVGTLIVELPNHQIQELSLIAKETVDKAAYLVRIYHIAKYQFKQFYKELKTKN